MHGIVASAVSAVNPMISAQLRQSSGYTTDENFKQVPAYADPVTVQVQVQALTYKDLEHLDSLNIQGERRALYIYGSNWNAVSRVDQRGGDLLTFAEYPGQPSRTWLLALVLEKWPDWVKAAVTLQSDEES